MGYDGLTKIDDALERRPHLDELVQNRLPHTQRLLDNFSEFYEDKFQVALQLKDNAAMILTKLYFMISFKQIKPVIQDKTNRFKMASLMELLIVKEQPFFDNEAAEIDNRKINANFALAAALSMIDSMITHAGNECYFMSVNVGVEKEVNKIMEDHKLWLATKQLAEMPIFINAQFHELIEVLYRAPYQIHG